MNRNGGVGRGEIAEGHAYGNLLTGEQDQLSRIRRKRLRVN